MTKIVITGTGVEDARSPAWGHIVRSLISVGHEVLCFDGNEAERLQIRKSPLDQWQWLLQNFKPDVVLSLANSGEFHRQMLAVAVQDGIRIVELHVPELSNAPFGQPMQVGCFIPSSQAVDPDSTRLVSFSDVAIVGDLSPEGQKVAERLVATGISLSLIGLGWGDISGLRPYAVGPVLYEYMSNVLAKSKVMLAIGDSTTQQLHGPVHAAFDATIAGLPVVTTTATQVSQYLASSDECVVAGMHEIVDVLRDLLGDAPRRIALASAARNRLPEYAWVNRWAAILGQSQKLVVRVTKDGPKISMITGTYNTREYIGASIESLLTQTEDDFELLVMNDGSTDDSIEVVGKYLSDPRVRLISQQNVGQTGRFDFIWNGLMPYARGELFGALGGDDIAMPNRLERQLQAFAEDPTMDVLHTAGIAINDAGAFTHKVFELDFSYDTSSQLRRLLKGNNIAVPTVLMKRSVFDIIGMWSGGFAADYRMWLQLARFARFRYLAEPLTAYRIHEKSASTSTEGGQSNDGITQGILTRLAAREQLAITDIYPALREHPESDTIAWAAAYIDLGNGHLRYLPEPAAALAEYAQALDLAPSLRPIVEHNMAAAYAMFGDVQTAQQLLHHSHTTDPSLLQFPTGSVVPAEHISTKPFLLSHAVAKQTLCWDGTPASLQRVLVVPDWNDRPGIANIVRRFAEVFDATREVDLVIPTAGLDIPTAMGLLQQALQGIDLSQCAPVTLELWDDLTYLPLDRFVAIVNMFDVNTFDTNQNTSDTNQNNSSFGLTNLFRSIASPSQPAEPQLASGSAR